MTDFDYSHYLAEHIVQNIQYSEYISENIISGINYSNYLTDNIEPFASFTQYEHKSIDYSEYLAEALGKSKIQILREKRIAKLNKLNEL